MGSASPLDEFPDGTLGAIDENVMAALWVADIPNSPNEAPEGLLRLGMVAEDLLLWPAVFNQSPLGPGYPEPSVAWSVLTNGVTKLANFSPWLTVHDALAWLIVDSAAVTDLVEGPMLLMSWGSIDPHGWLPYGAGVSLNEHEQGSHTDAELRVMAGLRGHTLPPFRTPG